MTITFNKELFDTMGSQEVYTIVILKDGIKVGRVDLVVNTENDEDIPEVDQGFGVYFMEA